MRKCEGSVTDIFLKFCFFTLPIQFCFHFFRDSGKWNKNIFSTFLFSVFKIFPEMPNSNQYLLESKTRRRKFLKKVSQNFSHTTFPSSTFPSMLPGRNQIHPEVVTFNFQSKRNRITRQQFPEKRPTKLIQCDDVGWRKAFLRKIVFFKNANRRMGWK